MVSSIGNVSQDKLDISKVIFGAGVFSIRYNPIKEVRPLESVHKALKLGINGFDTNPYYGNSEEILGNALESLRSEFPRSTYYIFTKAGRYGHDKKDFDYSAKHVRECVRESCRCLKTDYLDIVFAHDVEFVELEKVIEDGGILPELFKLKEEGIIKYVGISGYSLDILFNISRIQYEKKTTNRCCMSYSHYCLHNTQLKDYIEKFKNSVNVKYVLNASPLSMGLLCEIDPPEWHPASEELREILKQYWDKADSTVVGLSNMDEFDDVVSIFNRVMARKNGEKDHCLSDLEIKVYEKINQLLLPYHNWEWESPPPPSITL
ncbi:3260_t:CDS:2 [Entrophospora sp. SA101]|nr:3260_t:CDS:2 [Entrophospora sp. SA101]